MNQPSNPFKNVRRILIIKFKHIGDVLLSAPTITAMNEAFPEAEVSYLLVDETASMVSHHPGLKEAISFSRKRSVLHTLSLLWKLRRSHFDLVLNLSGSGDRGAIWGFLTGARYRIGHLRTGKNKEWMGKRYLYSHIVPKPSIKRHAVLRDLDMIAPFGIFPSRYHVDFIIPPETQEQTEKKLQEKGLKPGQPYGVVHPTTRWLFKCADDAVMAQSIDNLHTIFGLQVVVTCGPSEKELDHLLKTLALCQTQPIVLAGELSLKALGAVLSRSVIYLGVDSAPAHMAAALGIPSVVLFGPTHVYAWGPWPNEACTQPDSSDGGLHHSGPHVTLQKDWDCVSCGKDGCDGTKISRCLMEISTTEVSDAISRCLGKIIFLNSCEG